MSRPTVALALVVTLSAVHLPARAEEPAVLVQRLAADDYAARETATLRLFKLGRAATAALRDGLKSDDAEVRRRCAMLLPLAERSEQDVWLDGFVAGSVNGDPPTGWAALRKVAGDGLEARMLFAELTRTDKEILTLLEKDPARLASQAAERCRRLQARFAGGGAAKDDVPAGEVAAALLAAAATTNLDPQTFNQLTSLFYQPFVRAAVQRTPGASRLVARVLAQRSSDIYQMSQTAYMAKNLGLHEFIEENLKPALRKQAEGVQPSDPGRFSQVVYLARTLEMDDLIDDTLRPGVRKMAEEVAAKPDDGYRLQQVVNLAQLLTMQETLEVVLKPAGLKLIRLAAEKPEELTNRYWYLQYVGRALGLADAIETVLKPAACRHILDLLAQPGDTSKFYQAQSLARNLQLAEVIEGVLQPAVRKMILASLEQSPGDVGRVTQSIGLARGMDLGDLVEDTLKPWVRRHVASLKGEAGELTRLTQLHTAAQSVGLKGVIDDDLKPVFARMVQAAADQPASNANAAQVIALARTLSVKEAAPLALKVAKARDITAHTRGTAMFFLADFGTKEDIAGLEALLDDTTSVGSTGFNFTTVNAEVRDVALAVLIHSAGQSLADYGFPYFQTFPGVKLTTSWPGSVGFGSPAGREAALKKWKAWSASSKK